MPFINIQVTREGVTAEQKAAMRAELKAKAEAKKAGAAPVVPVVESTESVEQLASM